MPYLALKLIVSEAALLTTCVCANRVEPPSLREVIDCCSLRVFYLICSESHWKLSIRNGKLGTLEGTCPWRNTTVGNSGTGGDRFVFFDSMSPREGVSHAIASRLATTVVLDLSSEALTNSSDTTASESSDTTLPDTDTPDTTTPDTTQPNLMMTEIEIEMEVSLHLP